MKTKISKLNNLRASKGIRTEQQVQYSPSAEEIVQQEVQTPTTARLTLYLGAATVNIEVGSQ